MFSVDEIYEMLEGGKSVDDIAQTFTDNLNKAKKEYEEEQRRIQEEEKLDEEEKLEWLIEMLEDYHDWVAAYYPDLSAYEKECDSEVLAKEMIKLFDGLNDLSEEVSKGNGAGITGMLKAFGL